MSANANRRNTPQETEREIFDPRAVPIRRPEPRPVETPSPRLPQEAEAPAAIQPGMKCLFHGHAVRTTSLPDWDGMVGVYLCGAPQHSAQVEADALKPMTVEVKVGDTCQIDTGAGMPLVVSVLAVEGDYACFFSALYYESHWMHSSHVVSIRPRANH